jgi:hypothetical protein
VRVKATIKYLLNIKDTIELLLVKGELEIMKPEETSKK